jgi:uncharacterized alpha-E superfamily protein
MLSRVASHLYWMSRYLERAENMARILDVGQSLALLSGSGPGSGSGSDKGSVDDATAEPLVITDTVEQFEATGMALNSENITRFLAWDSELQSSIANCIEACRENVRAVRGSVTSEMWENINDTWLQLQQKRRSGDLPIDSGFFDWVKERSHLFRGISFATIRRDQPYRFIRLGTFIERGDNTARILSVKQISGVAARDDIGAYYRLSAVLRSVSALEAYRDRYRDSIEDHRVAELLIFDNTLPRSLRFCHDEISTILEQLPEVPAKLTRRLADSLHSRLKYGDVAEVFSDGLSEFLETFLEDNVRLGDAIHSSYFELK